MSRLEISAAQLLSNVWDCGDIVLVRRWELRQKMTFAFLQVTS